MLSHRVRSCYSASVRRLDRRSVYSGELRFAGIGVGADDLTFTRLQFIDHIFILKRKRVASHERCDAKLVIHIDSLSGSKVYDARLGIATTLKAIVSELKIASAGPNPTSGKPDGRIRRNGPGRYFEVTFRGGSPQTGFPVAQ